MTESALPRYTATARQFARPVYFLGRTSRGDEHPSEALLTGVCLSLFDNLLFVLNAVVSFPSSLVSTLGFLSSFCLNASSFAPPLRHFPRDSSLSSVALYTPHPLHRSHPRCLPVLALRSLVCPLLFRQPFRVFARPPLHPDSGPHPLPSLLSRRFPRIFFVCSLLRRSFPFRLSKETNLRLPCLLLGCGAPAKAVPSRRKARHARAPAKLPRMRR